MAALFPTGGTTGDPMIVRRTHRMYLVNAFQISQAIGLGADDVMLVGLPLFHVNAIVLSTLSTLFSGGTVLLAGRAGFRNPTLASKFWAVFERHRVTVFSGVPTVYAMLLDHDNDGFGTLTGWSKELIIRSGRNIAPGDIEKVPARHPDVSAGAVMDPLVTTLPASVGVFIAKAFVTVVLGGRAVVTGLLASGTSLGLTSQFVSFALNPVAGEIVLFKFINGTAGSAYVIGQARLGGIWDRVRDWGNKSDGGSRAEAVVEAYDDAPLSTDRDAAFPSS